MNQLLDDPEFVQQSHARIEFYRNYPEIAAEDLLRVELSDVQKVVLRSMWFQDYVICIMTRGGGKTFLHGVFASLKALLYPGHRVGLLAPTFRQAKMMFDEVTKLWQKAPILQAATEKKPTQQADNCYLRFKSTGLKNPSIIQALPLGDGCLSDGLIVTSDRFCLIQDLLSEDYTVSQEQYLKNTSVFGESGQFSDVEYVWSNGDTNNLRVTTHRGYSIEGTLNHPVRVVRNDEIIWSRLDNLQDSDYLVIDRSPVWHSGSSNITQEEAYVAGLLVGDGNYTNKYYLGFATKDEELIGHLNLYFSNRYGKKFTSGDGVHYKLSGKDIREDFLSRLGITGNLYTKHKCFPAELTKSEKYKVSSFIKGLFDTDGGFEVGKSKGGGCVSFYNTSEKLVTSLHNILLLFGIASTVSMRKSRYENWSDSYQLMVTGNDVELFYKQIGFGLSRKQQSLEKFVLHRLRRVSLSDGIPQAGSIINKITKQHSVRGLRKLCLNPAYIAGRYKQGIPSHRVISFVEHCIKLGIKDDRLTILADLVSKNYLYDKIECIQETISETYDVYVPNDHTFWSNGFISHNTKIRGARFYSILCDEFPHIPEEIFNMVIRPMAATVADPMENVHKIARRKRLIEKGLLTEAEAADDDHRANQIIITSSGYYTFNHMYKLYMAYKQEMLEGNDRYAVWRVPHNLLPEGFLDKDNVESARKQMSSLEFRMEYDAAFIPDTDEFYRASLLSACSQTSFSTQVAGTPEKTYCLGIDPARKEDSFAICVVEMGKPAKIVHSLEMQNQPFPRMAALVEDLCASFNVSHIYMDAQGGGLAIKDMLAENNRGLREGPILDRDDEIYFRRDGRKILTMCNFSTDFISDSNYAALRLLEHRELLFPSIPKDQTPSIAQEEAWLTIQAMKNQMQLIAITETPTGKNHFDVPKGGGHGLQKKDLYTAFMLAARCVYDQYWTDTLPEDILYQGGAIKERTRSDERSALPGLESYYEDDIPDLLLDKIQMVEDPEGYRQRMLQGSVKRTLVSAPSVAVLRPVSKK